MTTQKASSIRARPPAVLLLSSGLTVVCAAVLLYATSLSRATAGWIGPYGAVLVLAGLWTLRTGRLPHRALLVVLGIAALALLVLGLWALAVALQTEEQPA